MNMRISVFTLALLTGFATAANAQFDEVERRSNTTGFTMGISLNGSSLSVEDDDEVESGGGLSLRAGYGISNSLQLYATGTGASIQHADFDDTYQLGHFDLGARYLFGSAYRAARPYVNAAVSGRAARTEFGTETVDLRGTGFTFGGGLEYFLNRSVALEGGLDATFGDFSEGRVGDGDWQDLGAESFSATSARFNLGLAWHP